MRSKVAHSDAPDQPWSRDKNLEFMSFLRDASDGEVKIASTDGTNYTRRILRESQIQPNILPERTVTQNELLPLIPGYAAGTDISEVGVVLCNLEPGAPSARTVSIETAPEQDTYRGAWYHVAITKDEIPELVKNVDKLALYKDIDLRQVVTDLALRVLDNHPDYRLFQTVRETTGSDPNAVGAGGYLQYREVSGGMSTRQNYKTVFRPLLDATLINGVAVMSRVTANEFFGWDRNQVGGDKAQDILFDGTQGLSKFQFNNVPHIASIKSQILPLGEVVTFAPPNFVGQNLVYQQPTLWVKRVRDTITVYACAKRGAHIANTRTVARTKFLNL